MNKKKNKTKKRRFGFLKLLPTLVRVCVTAARNISLGQRRLHSVACAGTLLLSSATPTGRELGSLKR